MQTAALSPAGARQGITQNGLKLLALSLMLLDHIHYFFGFTGAIPLIFTWLGRLSAPLFLFCLVEGWAHTHSKKRYFLRIWLLGAAMGAVQYACILVPGLQRADGFFPQNAMLSTFTLILVMLWGADFVRSRKFLRGLLLLAAPHCLALFCHISAGAAAGQASGHSGAAVLHCAALYQRHSGRQPVFHTGRRAAVRPARPPRRAGRGVVRLDAAH